MTPAKKYAYKFIIRFGQINWILAILIGLAAMIFYASGAYITARFGLCVLGCVALLLSILDLKRPITDLHFQMIDLEVHNLINDFDRIFSWMKGRIKKWGRS